MDFTILAALPSWLDATIAFVKDNILPLAGSAAIVLVPLLSPIISNGISKKFASLRSSVSIGFENLGISENQKLASLDIKVSALSSIPAQVGEMLKPIISNQKEITSILMIMADNSRIPDEVKQSIKGIHESVVASEQANDAIIASQNEQIAALQKQVDELVENAKKQAEEADAKAKSEKEAAAKSKKTKKDQW